jgi:DNA-binding MarR family transcriptional regulator
MATIASKSSDASRRRRRLTTAVKQSVRELRSELSLLNYRVCAQLELNEVDLDCLDLITRHSPLSPSSLARRVGLHPATVTGIVDRLERGGWVVRDRDPYDRRAVILRYRADRNPELMRLYAGMNAAMDEICAAYSEADLELLADFLRRTTNAGRNATDELTSS